MRQETAILEEILMEQRVTNSLLRAASRVQLDALLQMVMADPVEGAIIRALVEGQKQAGILAQAVVAEAKVKERAVQLHVAELIEHGIIQRLGAGSNVAYQLAGLFSPAQLAKIRAGKRAKEDRAAE